MAGPRAETVIERLRLRAPAGELAPLRRELEQADWPRRPPQVWVIVRKVHARGPRGALSRRLVDSARQAVDAAVALDTSDADAAAAVRFDNLPDLLARLSADLVAGRAAGRWYWQRWQPLFARPVAAALGALWSEHVAHLPALAARLEAMSALAPVWTALGADQAQQLFLAFAHHAGVRLDAPLAAGPAAVPEVAPPHLLRRWLPVLAPLAADDPRRQLATLLVAVEWRPMLLRAAPVKRLREVAAALGGTASAARAPAGVEAPQPRWPAQVPGVELAPPPATADRAAHHATLPIAVARPSAETGRLDHAPALEQPQAPAQPFGAGMASPADGLLRTGYGGLFYLINVLDHPAIAQLLSTRDAWTALPDGWAWLYRLGGELGFDPADPLGGFLARQMGMEPGDMAALPELPCRRELLGLIRRLYGAKGLWTPELLAVPAQLAYTASHLDLYFAMNSVRLPVRLAGLDIDPGWVPWLGRVVSFHYVEGAP